MNTGNLQQSGRQNGYAVTMETTDTGEPRKQLLYEPKHSAYRKTGRNVEKWQFHWLRRSNVGIDSRKT